MSLSIGDTVRMQSGGALMTVQLVNGDMITCWWHDKNNVLQKAEYHVDLIEPDDGLPPAPRGDGFPD